MNENFKWLSNNKNNEQYKGLWVALKDGEPVSFGPSRVSLQMSVRFAGLLQSDVLFVQL